MITGMSRVTGAARSCSSTSKPLMPGIMMSSRIRSGAGACATSCRARAPGVGGAHAVTLAQQLAEQRQVAGVVVDDEMVRLGKTVSQAGNAWS